MAYQQVSRCRFYISYGDWWKSVGINVPRWQTISPYETYTLSTVEYSLDEDGDPNPQYSFISPATYLPSPDYAEGINWFACLNHNVTGGYGFRCKHHTVAPAESLQQDVGTGSWDTMVNFGPQRSEAHPAPEYQGFTLGTWNNPWTVMVEGAEETLQVGIQSYEDLPPVTFNVGCWVYGRYYNIPHSPDLSLTLEYDYSGIDTIETRGGATLSNARWTKPPKWGNLGAWELSDGTNIAQQPLSRTGRRIWSLNFSFIDDGDIFGANTSLTTDTWENEINGVSFSGDVTNDVFNYNILTDDSFYSQVVHKTQGGQLPFIFQPDKDDKTNFAICKFDSGFQFKQVANGLYSFSAKIREIW